MAKAGSPQVTPQDSKDKSNKASVAIEVKPLMGNEAIARGVWEAGVRVASAYPGTPSTEILENVAHYPEQDIEAEWATNEKVALDVAIGASFAGERAFAAMKHVGLNVASDALMSMTYIGVNGGLVIVVCDDPGIHSSQNEQDTRLFARLAMVPVLEPSDAQEALDFIKHGYEISEQFDTPVIVRSTTRLSHTRSLVRIGERISQPTKGFVDNIAKNVMIPSHARISHPRLIEREQKLGDYFNTSELNRWEPGKTEYGIITCGISYSYVKEVAEDASVLKLGASYPLAEDLISKFCESVDRVIVIEELEPVIEETVRKLGFKVEGKSLFSREGEFSPSVVRSGLAQAGLLPASESTPGLAPQPLARPPVLCSGCPHTSAYMALRSIDARVAGDIGCYTLAAIEPLKAIHTCVAMGSSIGNAVGMYKTGNETRPIVATIGDSTFIHGGIPPLIDAVYNQANITVLLLDNHTTAMTGGQDHAGTGKNLRGKKTERVDFESLIKAIGVKWVRKADSYNLGNFYKCLQDATRYKGVSVIISDRPCVLDPVKIKGKAFEVRAESCVGCQSCMNLGCPAISWSGELHDGHNKVKISALDCMGCSLCAQTCPSDAIHLPSET